MAFVKMSLRRILYLILDIRVIYKIKILLI